MQEFEVIGLDDGDGPQPHDFGESSVTSPNPPRWWLLAPVAVVFGLLIALSRGAVDQAVEESAQTSVPAATTVPTETDEDGLAALSLTPDDLRASFAGQVLLTGASGREIMANDLAAGTSFSLGIKGDPLYFVDGWLVYLAEAEVNVINLLDASSTPIVIMASEPSGSGLEVLVDASATLLTLTEFSYEGALSANATGFTIGQWDQTVAADSVGQWFRAGGVVSSPGSGTYELTLDGYQRRGDGFVVAMNRDLVVIWECDQSLSSCRLAVRERASWNEVGASVEATPNTDIVLAPQGSLAFKSNWLQGTRELVDLMTGDRIDLRPSDSQVKTFEMLLGASEVAVLAVADGRIVVVNRESGAFAQVQPSERSTARSGVLVESTLPYFMERNQ